MHHLMDSLFFMRYLSAKIDSDLWHFPVTIHDILTKFVVNRCKYVSIKFKICHSVLVNYKNVSNITAVKMLFNT